MNDLAIQDVVAETKALWQTGRKVMVQVAFNLSRIKNSDVWKEYDKFPKYCEEQLEIQQSQVSKLLTIAEYYLDKFSVEEIGSVDYEKLYQSALLPGSVEVNLAKAKTLSRVELKQEKAEYQPHPYEEVAYCKVCKLSKSNHP